MNPEQHQSFPGSLSQRGCNGKSGGGNSNFLDMDDIAARRRRLAGKESLEIFRSTADLGMKSGLGSHLPRRGSRFDKNPSVDSMLNEVAGVNTTTRGGEFAFTGNGTSNLNKSLETRKKLNSLQEEHPRCCQTKGSKVEEKLVRLKMVVKFEVLIEKKKMCSIGLMRFDWWMEFMMVHLEELKMKKLL
nr:hypothetical protein [Tanacetum cinerariifolium]